MNHAELIVSLTSFPARIKTVHHVIESILTQNKQPDRIVLVLAETEFPQKEENLPKEIIELTKNKLEILWVEENTRSYKKLTPTLNRYPDAVIVTIDDDLIYKQECIKSLWDAYIQAPDRIHTHWVDTVCFDKNGNVADFVDWNRSGNYKSSGYVPEPSVLNSILGGTGTLYPPKSLYKDVGDQSIFLKLSPTADDIWFWAMAVLNNTQVNLVKNPHGIPKRAANTQQVALSRVNIDEDQNNVQFRQVLSHYPELEAKLKEVSSENVFKPRFLFDAFYSRRQKKYTVFGREITLDRRAKLIGTKKYPNNEKRFYLFWVRVWTSKR
ncbi:MAG: hypothetical protein R3Y10_12165 [Ferrimonas sp.]